MAAVLPEELAPVENFASSHVENVDGEHMAFEVVAEDILVITFDGGNPLLLVELLHGGDQVAQFSGPFVLLAFGRQLHAGAERAREIGLASLEEKLNVMHGFPIGFRRRQALNARTEAALNVELKAGPRVIARKVNLAQRDQKIAVDQVHDAVSQIAGKVGAIILAAILFEPAGDINPRVAFGQSKLDIGVGFVVAEKNVEARLLLLDEVVLKGKGFFVVADNDVLDVHGLAKQGAGLGIGFSHPLLKIGADAGAQVLGLANINDLAFSVFIEINAGMAGDGPDFSAEIHGACYL